MTGGQPVDGIDHRRRASRARSRPRARSKVVVLSRRHRQVRRASTDRFPAGTEFHDRAELDAVQRRLREMPGVTVLIYEQTCAAEKRRRRKKGELVDPARRLFINERVCEGCGDCSVQSNCVAVLPLETDARPQAQDRPVELQQGLLLRQGLLPELRRRASAASCARSAPARWPGRRAARFAAPRRRAAAAGAARVDRPVRPAGHRRRRHRRGHRRRADRDGRAPRRQAASVLDFMGFAQKGGSVLSLRAPGRRPGGAEPGAHRRPAGRRGAGLRHRRRRVARCAADRAPRPHARARQHARDPGRRVALATRTPTCSVDALLREDASSPPAPSGSRRWTRRRLAEDFLGDTIVANIVAHGLRVAARPGAGEPGGAACARSS